MALIQNLQGEALFPFIPITTRLNLISLFHRYNNRIVLSNFPMIYASNFGSKLEIAHFSCRNINHFFSNMPNLFFMEHDDDIVTVNCYVRLGAIKFTKTSNKKMSLCLESLNDIKPLFKFSHFQSLKTILLKTYRNPMKISEIEHNYITEFHRCFDFKKYGFDSIADFFLTFADLFTITYSDSNSNEDDLQIMDSLSNCLIKLKYLPYEDEDTVL